jgi:hypothetical protein
MARVIETTAYKFSELSENAKEKARDWYYNTHCTSRCRTGNY